MIGSLSRPSLTETRQGIWPQRELMGTAICGPLDRGAARGSLVARRDGAPHGLSAGGGSASGKASALYSDDVTGARLRIPSVAPAATGPAILPKSDCRVEQGGSSARRAAAERFRAYWRPVSHAPRKGAGRERCFCRASHWPERRVGLGLEHLFTNFQFNKRVNVANDSCVWLSRSNRHGGAEALKPRTGGRLARTEAAA